MADDNQRWPSENEDFDAVTDTSKPSNTVGEPKSVPVAVADENHDEPSPADETPMENQTEEEESMNNETETAKPDAVAPAAAKSVGSKGGNVGRVIFEAVLLIIIVALGLWAWMLHSDNTNLTNQVNALNNNPQITVQKQTQALIAKVAKLIQLPSGETPTIANVTDAAAAKKQSAFFTNAQNGDRVLMYVKAGEAILYRPSTNKIILVAPLTFNNSTATTPSTTKK
ncbi:MAG TPA: hypothetical protein VHB51_04510 [Candidatus Saccharimonadales bacterium]|nr:hypothetical protein [Candidatus Saccharimonadales bacterium]